MMISYASQSGLFQFRAASIVLYHNKILLQRASANERWFIPGGRVEFGETAEQTIDREMLEEFGVPILEKKLVWIIENLIEFQNKKVHEIAMYFAVRLQEDHPILQHEGEFLGFEEEYVNRWVDLSDLDELEIVPEFVVPELKALDLAQGVKHIVNRGVRNYSIS
ncbi:NUDIX hydrolase [Paenibacillus spongiae]|uniref:NUDIX domain-containing protein n=1 Tax=Paenibacillus spongiae TaxID=2909671 RepID=A0ABY5S2X3_9BACL|nr:NUDIX domain-containing protein [Paenibacillus spongiae]UVI28024.1 NUDIX domain-containing protein [Paenibacillus spongiae]